MAANIKTTLKPRGKSMVESAYLQIKERILNNEYQPGFQAMEPEVAKQLGMSRTPVREALIRLANEGLVEIIPRRGMRVVPLSVADMEEIYQVLTALEAMAAEVLARREPTLEELAPMEDAVNRLNEALENDDLDAWAVADEKFHRSLLELCGNQRLASMAATVYDQAFRARMISLRLRPKPWKSNEEHKALLDAIKEGDWQKARKIHGDHRRNASRVLTEVLEKYQLKHL
jgi:DNA-binding GntR family transcriptional regulator